MSGHTKWEQIKGLHVDKVWLDEFNPQEGGDFNMSISKLFEVAALVSFGAAVLGSTILGHSGLELVASGLFFHAGAGLAEDVLGE